MRHPLRAFLTPALQFSVVTSVVLPLVLFTAAAIYGGLQWTENILEKRLQEEIELLARAIQQPLSQSLEERQYDELESLLESMFTFDRVYGASVYDVDGQLLAAAGLVDSDLTQSRIATAAVESGEQRGGYRRVSGRDVFSYFTPLIDAGGRIGGLVQITRKRSDFDEGIDELRAWAWWAWGAVSLLLGLIAVVGHYRGVGRHVATQLHCMAEIERGQRHIRAEEEGPREMRQLARGLNHMLQGVLRAEQAVEAHRERERELNSRLRYSEKMAEIGRVAGGVAHELGAPLNVVDGRALQLQKRCQAAGIDVDDQVRSIRAQVERMAGIVRELLDFCRHSPSQMRVVNPERLREPCEQLVGDELKARDIALDWRGDVGDARIMAEPSRLEQALRNILRNAIQAATSRVELTVEAVGDHVIFAVADDGPGLSEAEAEQVFEPFFTTKPPGQGTGLGLALVRSIADEHDAEITLERNSQGGCTFVLKLPVYKPANNVVGIDDGEGDSKDTIS